MAGGLDILMREAKYPKKGNIIAKELRALLYDI